MFTTRTYVALAALAAAGAATLFLTTRPDAHVRQKPLAPPFPAFAAAAIDELEIDEPGKPPVVLKLDGSAWKLTAPVADVADPEDVKQALDQVAGLAPHDAIAENPASYDKVGMKADEIVKVIPKHGGAPLVTLLVGKTGNVRFNDDARVWTTVTPLRRGLLVREVKEWRERHLFSLPADGLSAVSVAYGDHAPAFTITKAAPASQPAATTQPARKLADKWTVTLGADKIGGPVDESVPTQLAYMLGHLQAEDVVADDVKPAVTGLDHPRAFVTVAGVELAIGKDDGQSTYVKRTDGPRVWKMRKQDADHVPTSPIQWRDKLLAKVDAKDLTKLEIVSGADRTVLERVDDKTWKASFPPTLTEVDPARVAPVVRSVQGLRAARFVENPDAKALGLDKPTLVVTATKKDGTSVKISFGAKDKNGEWPAQVAGQKDVVAVSDFLVEAFVKKPSDFAKTATPVPGPPHPPAH